MFSNLNYVKIYLNLIFYYWGEKRKRENVDSANFNLLLYTFNIELRYERDTCIAIYKKGIMKH